MTLPQSRLLVTPSMIVPVLSLWFLALSSAMAMVPIMDHEGGGAFIREWWARLAPARHAMYLLRDVDRIRVYDPASWCIGAATPYAAWQAVVRHPKADSLLAQIVAEGTPSGRAYGLAGLSVVAPEIGTEALANGGADAVLISRIVGSETVGGSITHTRMAMSAFIGSREWDTWVSYLQAAEPNGCRSW